MKRLYILFVFYIFIVITMAKPLFAMSVGNPLDLDIPPSSALLREQAINEALDDYESPVKIKLSLEQELLFDKKLHTTYELKNAKIEGKYQMIKIGTTIFNRFEPYIKIGTSDLEASWNQHTSQEIKIDADSGLAWGGGLKAVLWDFEPLGINLTFDAQYRVTEPDVSECTMNDREINDKGGKFKINEYQASLLLSKKTEILLKWGNSIYVIPYTGITLSDSNADIKVIDPSNPGTDYDIFDANNDSIYGFVAGFDILPSLSSFMAYNMELRLNSETALSIGGSLRF